MRFKILGIDEGGVKQSQGNLRIVCRIDGGGKLAVWGIVDSPENIEKLRGATMPCEIECDCVAPQAWAVTHGHTHWVPPGYKLQVYGPKAVAAG